MPLPSLVTVEELKVYIGVNDDVTEFDAQLRNLARNATKLLETFCRRTFATQEYAEYFSTRNSEGYDYDLSGADLSGVIANNSVQRFSLKGFPIDGGEDIVVNFDPTHVFAADTALEDTDYVIVGNTLYVKKAIASSVKGLLVTYTGGYAVTEEEITAAVEADPEADPPIAAADAVVWDIISGAPDDLKMACVTQVLYMFNKYREGNVGVIGADKHSPQYERNGNLLCTEAMAFAAPYKRLLLGQR